MRELIEFTTSSGVFYIAEHEGRFHPVFQEERLGSYATLAQAVEDLAGGHTFTPSNGVDTSSLGIPEDPGAWDRVAR